MSAYIIFFGKSQDFTTYCFDRNNPIDDFNSVIKDFDLLESKIFTVDDIKNKEILSRYLFSKQGRKYSLLKLYSFAQAINGNRIAGSIYGVALLSEESIQITKNNLALLRAAKENFAKLSLNGVKFNKSNFREDVERIWNAIITNSEGNLLDKIETKQIEINEDASPIAFLVKNLFQNAEKLNGRIESQDTVYFSEDLDHLKRTQNKWGKEAFPIYREQNDKYVIFQEIIQPQPIYPKKEQPEQIKILPTGDNARLQIELEDLKYENKNIQYDLEKTEKRLRFFQYVSYALTFIIFALFVYILFFSTIKKQDEHLKKSPLVKENQISNEKISDPLNYFLTDNLNAEKGVVFFKSIQFIYSFEVSKSVSDSSTLHLNFDNIQKIAIQAKINIDNVRSIYLTKCEEIRQFSSTRSEKPSVKISSSPPAIKKP